MQRMNEEQEPADADTTEDAVHMWDRLQLTQARARHNKQYT